MWYLVIRRDVAPRHTWTATLDEHLGWMKTQHAAGNVLFSGPTADIRTGIYVIRAASSDDARRIAGDDPFTRAGHCTFDLYEWDVRQILGTGPFSVAELDALDKVWRPGWTTPEPGATPPAATAPNVAAKVSADWTAGRMLFQLSEAVESYVVGHSLGYGPAGTALVSETAALGEPAVMMIAKEQYAVLRFLAGLLGCTRALDVGTFTGLSALAFAEGMGREGRVTTIDRNPAWVDVARRHWNTAGVGDRMDVRIGEAIDVLAGLAADPQARYDIAFIDVDKARIDDYFECALGLLAPNGLIMVDNALWHGWVLDDTRIDPDTAGMRRFNARIAADARLDAVLLPIADGLWLIRRRSPTPEVPRFLSFVPLDPASMPD